MKEIVHQWLEQRVPVAGVLACAVRFADKTFFSKRWTEDFPEAALANAMQRVAETLEAIQTNDLPSARLRWIFGNVLLYCERRADNVSLSLFAVKDAQSLDFAGLERLVAEFHALKP